MSRTHNQQMADAHEADIAEWIGGKQTKGSGNQWHQQMDAKNGINKVPYPIAGDGKATLGKSIGISREMWKKAEEQSFGEIPAIFLRFYRDSTLRTVDKDLVVLTVSDFKWILNIARTHATQEIEMATALEAFAETDRMVQSFAPQRLYDCPTCKNPVFGRTSKTVDATSETIAPELLELHGHDYLSTYCGHAQLGGGATHLHDRCREKCKICGSHCNCGCHIEATA